MTYLIKVDAAFVVKLLCFDVALSWGFHEHLIESDFNIGSARLLSKNAFVLIIKNSKMEL